jgi:hypothetical protein
MSEHARRVGENEALFRSVNEQVHDLNQTFLVEGMLRIVCECGEQTCIDQIDVAPSKYESVRADPTLFLIKPGHELPDFETIVDRSDTYFTVRKAAGLPEQIAHETDPRR